MRAGYLRRQSRVFLAGWLAAWMLSCEAAPQDSLQTPGPPVIEPTSETARLSVQLQAVDAGVQLSQRAKHAAELVRRWRPALSHDVTGLRATSLGSGVRKVDLQGRFHHALVAYVDDDGQLQYGCVDSAERAEALLAGKSGAKR